MLLHSHTTSGGASVDVLDAYLLASYRLISACLSDYTVASTHLKNAQSGQQGSAGSFFGFSFGFLVLFGSVDRCPGLLAGWAVPLAGSGQAGLG